MTSQADRLLKERDAAIVAAEEWRATATDALTRAARAEGESVGLRETVAALRQALDAAREAAERVSLAAELERVRAELARCQDRHAERANQPTHVMMPGNGTSRG